MKKSFLYIVLYALLMFFLFLPFVQQVTGMVGVRRLEGAVAEVTKPHLTFDSYKSLSWQNQLEEYVASHFGFHESVIRMYNQYLWSFYRKTYAADVAIGKDKWLYGKNSVRDHYRQLAYEYADGNETLQRRFEKDLHRLKKVQDLLDERGTKLFVLICPAKDLIYPEHLPESGNWVMRDGMRAIDFYPQAFADQGINFVDVNAWFQQIKDTVGYPLFTRSGMHWSNIACVHASDSIFRYMEHLTGKNMPDMKIGPMYTDAPRNPDADLERNLNLASRIMPTEQYYYADVEVLSDSTATKLNLITMGDSFFWNMCYSLPMDSLFERHPYWYYFSTIFYDPQHTHVSQINLVDELDHADVLMISLSATQLYDINHGLLSQALVKLSSKNPSQLDAILHSIKRQMEANDEWYESLKQKAAQKGKLLEEVMDEDALYVYNQNPEKYFTEAILEQIKQAMRNDSAWFKSLGEKAVQNGKTLEQVMDEDAIYMLNQNPEKYLE